MADNSLDISEFNSLREAMAIVMSKARNVSELQQQNLIRGDDREVMTITEKLKLMTGLIQDVSDNVAAQVERERSFAANKNFVDPNYFDEAGGEISLDIAPASVRHLIDSFAEDDNNNVLMPALGVQVNNINNAALMPPPGVQVGNINNNVLMPPPGVQVDNINNAELMPPPGVQYEPNLNTLGGTY